MSGAQMPGDQPVHFFCTSKVITLEEVYVKIDAGIVLAAGTDYLWTCLLAHITANDSTRGRVKKKKYKVGCLFSSSSANMKQSLNLDCEFLSIQAVRHASSLYSSLFKWLLKNWLPSGISVAEGVGSLSPKQMFSENWEIPWSLRHWDLKCCFTSGRTVLQNMCLTISGMLK